MSRIKVSELYCADKSVLLRAINSDADKCDEMQNTFDNNEADGYPREKMTASDILREAENALEFYFTGSIAEECADGNKQALKEKRQLLWFTRKWKKILSDRRLWKAASAAASESAPVITETAEQQTETESESAPESAPVPESVSLQSLRQTFDSLSVTAETLTDRLSALTAEQSESALGSLYSADRDVDRLFELGAENDFLAADDASKLQTVCQTLRRLITAGSTDAESMFTLSETIKSLSIVADSTRRLHRRRIQALSEQINNLQIQTESLRFPDSLQKICERLSHWILPNCCRDRDEQNSLREIVAVSLYDDKLQNAPVAVSLCRFVDAVSLTLRLSAVLRRRYREAQSLLQTASETVATEAATQKSAAPVAVITVTESAVAERQAELTEAALQRRCVALNSALQRLQRLRDSRRKLKKGIDRRNQGQILLSAVACLRLSILTVSAALEQRRRLTETYKQQGQRFQHITRSASESVLQAKTYRTSGMFPRLEIDHNEEKTASESLQRLQADSETLTNVITLNCAADRICGLLQSAELLVKEFCRIRSLVIEETRTATQNQTQVELCSVLLASCHSDMWRNRKNGQNTVNGINGQCLQNIERFTEDLSLRLPDKKRLRSLTASGRRILRSSIDKRSPKIGRVNLSLGQRLLSYLNSDDKSLPYWKTVDRLSAYWFNRQTSDRESAVEFQWRRQTFNLDSQLKSSIPAEHKLVKFAETLRLLTGQGQDREKTSYSVIMRNSEKLSLPGNEMQRLRMLLRLWKFGQQTDSDADRLRQRLQAFQRLRAAHRSSVCHDAVTQAVLSAPEIVGSLSLTDPETQQTFSVSVCRCSVETGTDENQEYFLSGELSDDAASLLNPVASWGTHRTAVITYHCRQGQTQQTDRRAQFRSPVSSTESAVSAVCSAAPVETATDTDKHGIEVLLRRCVLNIALAIDNRKKHWLKTATAEELRKRQRQEKAAVLLRLLRLQEVRFTDSLSAGNCQAGSQAFITGTLRLPAETQSVSGAQLARLWKATGYNQNSLFFNVIRAAEQRQQTQAAAAAASLN